MENGALAHGSATLERGIAGLPQLIEGDMGVNMSATARVRWRLMGLLIGTFVLLFVAIVLVPRAISVAVAMPGVWLCWCFAASNVSVNATGVQMTFLATLGRTRRIRWDEIVAVDVQGAGPLAAPHLTLASGESLELVPLRAVFNGDPAAWVSSVNAYSASIGRSR